MITVYTVFKFLHIVAAIIWLGSVITLTILNARLARIQDRAVQTALAQQSRFFGMAVTGPAAAATLIAGIVMLAVSGLGAPLWVRWGFAAIVLSLALGATLLRRASQQFIEHIATAQRGDARAGVLQRRLVILNIINILLLLSTVWMMVLKPTL